MEWRIYRGMREEEWNIFFNSLWMEGREGSFGKIVNFLFLVFRLVFIVWSFDFYLILGEGEEELLMEFVFRICLVKI